MYYNPGFLPTSMIFPVSVPALIFFILGKFHARNAIDKMAVDWDNPRGIFTGGGNIYIKKELIYNHTFYMHPNLFKIP